MRNQNTISHEVSFTGLGIHSGRKTVMKVRPARPNTGIVFIRPTTQGNAHISYRAELVTDTQNQIELSLSGATVKTVEHLTAALYALKIDNAEIECTGVEVPIMDGSSNDFYNAFLLAGIVEQPAIREEFRITQPVWVTEGDKFIVALPYEGLRVHYTIDFQNSPIGTQVYQAEINAATFGDELKRARTFGFVEDLEKYLAMGLSQGVSMENVQVYSRKEGRMLNSPRYTDEPVRHKVLDLIGGIAILPFDLKAFIITFKGGHKMDIMFARQVLAARERAEKVQEFRRGELPAVFPPHVLQLLENAGIHA